MLLCTKCLWSGKRASNSGAGVINATSAGERFDAPLICGGGAKFLSDFEDPVWRCIVLRQCRLWQAA